MDKILRTFTWAWVIIIGGLMITPGGIECTACGGMTGTLIVGVISVALGVAGYLISKQQSAVRKSA